MLTANFLGTCPQVRFVPLVASLCVTLQIRCPLPYSHNLVTAASSYPFAIEVKLDIMDKIIMLEAEAVLKLVNHLFS
jgi:hypothetical protein